MRHEPPRVPGAPTHELTRSPATAAVGRLAEAGGLRMFHFEHRLRLPLPEAWVPEDRPDLGEPPGWQAGVLPESKYQGFRHDLLLGSFHPGHRAKWTGHELCHGVVGFAWRPDASRLFHALAARLAEALPVALWYWLDEAQLRRCPRHAGEGPLHQAYCEACERAAMEGPRDADAPDAGWLREGRRFVERELAAIARSRKLGRPVSHRAGPLDLASDGLAYAAGHGARLGSPEFERWTSSFFGREDGSPEREGLHHRLEDLEARVLEVLDALTGEGDARPLHGDPWLHAARDVGWRLLQVRADTEGEARNELDRLVDALADAPTEAGIRDAIDGYEGLHREWVVPEPEDVFAVGYPLTGGYGRSTRQLLEGLESGMPATRALLGPDAREEMARFAARDPLQRRPLGRRAADHARASWSAPAAELVRYEAAVNHAQPLDEAALTLGWDAPHGELVRLAEGLERLRVHHDVAESMEHAHGEPPEPFDEPVDLAIFRSTDGSSQVLQLSARAAEGLERLAHGPIACDELELTEEELVELASFGLVVPAAWSLKQPEE